MILNPESLNQNKIYWCNGIVADYLIKKGISLLCKKGRAFGFAKTKDLEKALDKMPIWLRISKIL